MPDLPATITALGQSLSDAAPFVVAVGAILAAWWAYRGKNEAARAKQLAAEGKREIIASKVEIIRIGDEVFEIGKKVDGRLTDLLEAMAAKGVTDTAKAHLEGVAEGEQRQRDRQAPPETSADGGRRNADHGDRP